MPTTHRSHGSHNSHHPLLAQDRNQMKDSTYAFPEKRKEPLNDAAHVRNAIARFDQVKSVSDREREEAFHNIKKAAKKFGVDIKESDWKQLGHKPHTANSAH